MNKYLALIALFVGLCVFAAATGTVSAKENNDNNCGNDISQSQNNCNNCDNNNVIRDRNNCNNCDNKDVSQFQNDCNHCNNDIFQDQTNCNNCNNPTGVYDKTQCEDPCPYDSQIPASSSDCVPTCENGGIDSNSDECHTFLSICYNGDQITVRDDSETKASNNCDPVRLCIDGESATVTEYDAESLLADGATKGSCTPFEPPPETIINTTTTEPVPVQQVEAAVSEVSPATDEVAALPSAGYGKDSGINHIWVAVFALALAGLGSSAALMARRK
jgi:hypothetical protein